MERVRKIRWFGWIIQMIGASVMLYAGFALQPPVRRYSLVTGLALILFGSTVNLIWGLREQKARTISSANGA